MATITTEVEIDIDDLSDRDIVSLIEDFLTRISNSERYARRGEKIKAGLIKTFGLPQIETIDEASPSDYFINLANFGIIIRSMADVVAIEDYLKKYKQ